MKPSVMPWKIMAYNPFTRPKDRWGRLVLTQLIRNIQAARFGVYRIDQQASTNTFLALGIAVGLNKPWLLVAREGADIPQDVRGLNNFNFRSFK